MPGRCGGGGVPAGAVFSTPPGEGASLLAEASRRLAVRFFRGASALVHATHRNVDAIVGSRGGSEARPSALRTALRSHQSGCSAELKRFRELIQSVYVSLGPSGVSPEEFTGHDDRGFALVLVMGGHSRRFFLIASHQW